MNTLNYLIQSILNLPNTLTPLNHPDYLSAIKHTLTHELNFNPNQIENIINSPYVTINNKHKTQTDIKYSFCSLRLQNLSQKDLYLTSLFLDKYRQGIPKHINHYSCLSIDLYTFAKSLTQSQTKNGINYTLNNKLLFTLNHKEPHYNIRTSISISYKFYHDIHEIIRNLPFKFSFTDLFFNFIVHYTEFNNGIRH